MDSLKDRINNTMALKRKLVNKGIVSIDHIKEYFDELNVPGVTILSVHLQYIDFIIHLKIDPNVYTGDLEALMKDMLLNLITKYGEFDQYEMKSFYDTNILSSLYFIETYPDNIHIIRY